MIALLHLTSSDRCFNATATATLKLGSSIVVVVVPRHQVQLLLSPARFL
jgi:hypothetical protein